MITDQFRILGDLGVGATAEVKLVEDVYTGGKFACKVIKTGQKGINGQLLADVQKEVTIMSMMKHKHIINTNAVGRGPYDKQDGSEPKEVLFIVMELAPEGEIFDLIANTGKFSEPVARYFFLQILGALSYMHNEVGVCHRDLKPENILMDSDFNLKLADWGFSIPLAGPRGNGKLASYKGTLGYMPPEQHAKKTYSGKSADMFAVAVVLFMMITQCQPFDEAKVTDKYYRLIAGNRSSMYWKIFDKVVPLSEDLKDLLTGMIQLDPSARYTIDEVLAHPWMQGPVPTHEQIKKEFIVRSKTNQATKIKNTQNTHAN
jgi:serine/threonine protein kinase